MAGTIWETVTLTTLSRDRAIFPQLLHAARTHALGELEGKLVVSSDRQSRRASLAAEPHASEHLHSR